MKRRTTIADDRHVALDRNRLKIDDIAIHPKIDAQRFARKQRRSKAGLVAENARTVIGEHALKYGAAGHAISAEPVHDRLGKSSQRRHRRVGVQRIAIAERNSA